MVGPARVDYHAMQGPALLDNLVYGGSDRGLLRDVSPDVLEFSRPPFLRCSELVARLSVVNRVDNLSAVVQA